MIEKLTISSFHPHAGDEFEVMPKSGEKVALELVEIRDTSTDMVDAFHLIFRGPADKVFSHDTHRVSHSKMGEFDLFLGPIIYGKTDGIYYQAVFSRLRPKAKALMKKAGKAVKKGVKKTAMKPAGKTPAKASEKALKKKAAGKASRAKKTGKSAKGKTGKKR